MTASCLQQSNVIEFIPRVIISCSVSLSSLGSFYHVLNRIEGGNIVSQVFGADSVDLDLSLPKDKTEDFQKVFNSQFYRTDEGELK